MGGSLKRRMDRQQERTLRAEAYSQLTQRLEKVEQGILRIDGVLGKLIQSLGQAGILNVQKKTRGGLELPPGVELPEELKQ